MSMLASLTSAYDRMAQRGEVPPFRYSSERIGFLISLNEDGNPAGKPVDLREAKGKKLVAPLMAVPTSFKRPGITPRSFFLWDNTAFSLGISASQDKDPGPRLEAFRSLHRNALSDTDDPGLRALLRFIDLWLPERFETLGWPEEMKDQNVVFALESDRRHHIRIHDRPAAKALWTRLSAEVEGAEAVCLVTGEKAPVARLHPAIKGVWGAQTSGASIVSFNLDSFESYGHEQGDNAPISERSASAYTTALNRFLESGSKNRIQIGDASTVFWADGSDIKEAEVAESIFSAMLGGEAGTDDEKIDEQTEAAKVGAVLDGLRKGKPLAELAPELTKGVRFYVLGLAPNAARLSIRFWFEDDFGVVAERYRRFVDEMRIEPPPRDPSPPLWRYLVETAAMSKRENVPPNLAGEWLRAILTGNNYPLTLLSTVLMRLRADKNVNALRVAMLKAVLMRNFNMEVPMAFDPDFTGKGYLLGRLFAVYEQVQSAALGRNVNATIKDKFYGSASAQPRKVFHLLDSGSANHLSKIGKQSPGHRVSLEKRIGAIMDMMTPGEDPFPASLPSEQQALFGLGYHHQRNEFFKSRETAQAANEGEH
ncbi:type I-C CRISPR-associated protein Cas8c/Csd1 [Chelativorans xinjiangense]|uniref:type I-C CRISPR-associated protein Cas8c/Csd1 n=1 Tax=Chelativorans xinjiangense TaxID=2681485 RepID=UPI00135B85ED|nr:type I-C CRISPR-associated protein Cas8c/Csd1 [Chelativorans xinjiangense]